MSSVNEYEQKLFWDNIVNQPSSPIDIHIITGSKGIEHFNKIFRKTIKGLNMKIKTNKK